jgi:hypothetical protein
VRIAEENDVSAMLELYRAKQKNVLSVFRTHDSMGLQRKMYGDNMLVYESDGVITAYGVRTGKRMLEVLGPDASALVAASKSVCGYTLPTEGAELVRNGCVLPLTPQAEKLLLAQNGIVYLNLMWN